MKAWIIRGYDGEERAELAEVATPAPGPDEVLVKVVAAAVNPLDMKLARGHLRDVFPLELPHVLGTDLAGTVEGVGERVTGWRVGERVLARLQTIRGGAFAEYAVVPSRLLTRAPERLGFEDAAALVTVGATAWQALFEVARVSSSTRLLVTGGAGSVGSMAVRLAASVGAEVYATALARDVEVAKKLGAERVFDGQREGHGKIDLEGLDVVFDTVGGDGQRELFGLLRDGALLAAIPMPPDAEAGPARNIDAQFVFHEADGSRLSLVASYCAAKGITPAIDRVMPLSAGRDAIALVASGRARGKVVLKP